MGWGRSASTEAPSCIPSAFYPPATPPCAFLRPAHSLDWAAHPQQLPADEPSDGAKSAPRAHVAVKQRGWGPAGSALGWERDPRHPPQGDDPPALGVWVLKRTAGALAARCLPAWSSKRFAP